MDPGVSVLAPQRGTELAYAENTSHVTGIPVGGGDVTGLTITFTVAGRPVYVFVHLPLVGQVTSTGQPTFYITEGVISVARSQHPASIAAAAFGGGVVIAHRFAAGAGAKTVKVTATTTAGTVSVFSDGSAGGYRAKIWAEEK